MSFLKGTALDYFEPFPDNLDDEPAWLKDYKLFVKELLINFGPYDTLVDAKAELNALLMKDNHNATKFFILRVLTSCHMIMLKSTSIGL